MKTFDQIREKTLTPAELKKREEVAKAIKRENPNMPMAKKMAIATATAKKVAEAKDPGEYDYEGDMAKNSLRTICRASGEMVAMMDENTNLPEWVQSKITLSEDYITSAYNYMMSEAEEMDESVNDMASMGNRSLSRIANTPNHPDAAGAKNELARRRMKNEERVISGGYRDKDGKYHPPQTASSIAKDRLAKKAAIMKKTATAMRSEDTELDESITRVSDAKLKFHAVNGVPHGSYSKKEISAEHNRRKMTGGSQYAAVKPSMNEAVTEAADMSKLKLLARAGLVDQKNVEKLMAAFKVMQAGKPLSQQQKDLVISSYGELASIVTGDSQIFQKAKKAVAEAIVSSD